MTKFNGLFCAPRLALTSACHARKCARGEGCEKLEKREYKPHDICRSYQIHSTNILNVIVLYYVTILKEGPLIRAVPWPLKLLKVLMCFWAAHANCWIDGSPLENCNGTPCCCSSCCCLASSPAGPFCKIDKIDVLNFSRFTCVCRHECKK